jgi:hypothetical protein
MNLAPILIGFSLRLVGRWSPPYLKFGLVNDNRSLQTILIEPGLRRMLFKSDQ